MSRRNSEDPLLREFLDTYKLNLLSIPRENAKVGDVYVRTPTGITQPGALQFMLTPKFTMPKITCDEEMTGISGKQTSALNFKAGVSLLDGFFSVLGAAGALDKVKAAYEHKKTGKLRFRFKAATRDSVDTIAFGKALIPCRLDERHPFVQPENSYYVTVGVVRSKSITVSASDDSSNKVSLDVGALKKTIGVDTKIGIDQGREGELTYEGRVPLAFGVELLELSYNNAENKFLLDALDRAQKIRAAPPTDSHIERSFIGDVQDGNAFIAVTD
jgi:hypothetical protein